jgi:hypothetical protein
MNTNGHEFLVHKIHKNHKNASQTSAVVLIILSRYDIRIALYQVVLRLLGGCHALRGSKKH